jgi:hypothetical protein
MFVGEYMNWLRKLCQMILSQALAVSFTEDEARKILNTRQRLRQWYSLAVRGALGAPTGDDLKSAIMDVIDLSNRLYEWYVPPFSINRVQLTEQELSAIINDLKSKGGMVAWLRLDRAYYATDLDTFKKIVEWDWTDTREYLFDTFDCDKFAMYFKARVSIDFGINAIGVILDYSSAHAYNLVIVKDSKGVRWYLYEPQTDEIFTYEQRNQSFYAMKQYVLLL